MKIHLITVGSPKLPYAKAGWEEYISRLKHFHQVRITHLLDKHDDAAHLLEAAGNSYKVALIIGAKQLTSLELAAFLEKRALDGREMSFIIGGPEGLPELVQAAVDLQWGFSELTFPHDLAMVVLAETLYRASTINGGLPYHRE